MPKAGRKYVRATSKCARTTRKHARAGKSRARARTEPAPELPFPNTWGGARPGSGPKKKRGAGVSHQKRPELSKHHPVHVTIKLVEGLPSLRLMEPYHAILRCFEAIRERDDFRVVHFSIQVNHVHLVVEAEDREALSRGMRGLQIRIARALNKLWERKGQVFADRYHARILKGPREVRNALEYVLNNCRRHGRWPRQADYFSSGPVFDGWKEGLYDVDPALWPVSKARTWLASEGWKRCGLIGVFEIPGRRRKARKSA
jgi:REP element-mobilizing transposase RayT